LARSLGSAVAFVGRVVKRKQPSSSPAKVAKFTTAVKPPAGASGTERRLRKELGRLEKELERCYAMITSTARSDGGAPDLQALVARARELRSSIADVRDDLDRTRRHLAREARLREPVPDLLLAKTAASSPS